MQLTQPKRTPSWPRLERATAIQGGIMLAVLALCGFVGIMSYRLRLDLVLLGLLGLGGVTVFLLFIYHHWELALTLLVALSPFINKGIRGGGANSYISFTMLFVTAAFGVWLFRLLSRPDEARPARNELNLPIILFTIALLMSWLVGYFVLDWRIRLPADVIIVQAGQFVIYTLSLAAFLLTANNPVSARWLRRIVLVVIVIGVITMVGQTVFGHRLDRIFRSMRGAALMWPVVFIFGQLLFNPRLKNHWRIAGWGVLAVWAVWALTFQFAWKSAWVPAAMSFALMLWFKDRRLALLLGVVGAVIGGILYFNTTYIFNQALAREDASLNRPLIWYDVARMANRSPVFGLGLANYEYYWFDPTFESASIEEFNWANPARYSPPSHSMLVDIYAQAGIFGTLTFLYLIAGAVSLSWRARRWFPPGFHQGYVYAVGTGFVSMFVVSVFIGDWLLPFVYNINISGFQHSVYSWLFLGTLVALDPAVRSPDNGS